MFVYNPSRINVGSIAWLDESAPVIVSPMYVVFEVDDEMVTPAYLMLFLNSKLGRSRIESRTEVGARFRLTYASLSRIAVPLPPIPVQRLIVQTLNQFTELEAALEAELEARRAQAQFYRADLISSAATGAAWRSLGEVASVRTGQAPRQGVPAPSGEYSFVNAGTTESGRSPESNTDGDTVTIPSRGQGGVGVVGYQVAPFWCGPLCYRIRSSTEALHSRFLYYFLKSIQPSIRALQQAAGTPALNRKELILVEVPLPPIEIQERVVGVLDQFDALVNDISIGLPAELAARRKQYEYYRDKLLTFEEAAA